MSGGQVRSLCLEEILTHIYSSMYWSSRAQSEAGNENWLNMCLIKLGIQVGGWFLWLLCQFDKIPHLELQEAGDPNCLQGAF